MKIFIYYNYQNNTMPWTEFYELLESLLKDIKTNKPYMKEIILWVVKTYNAKDLDDVERKIKELRASARERIKRECHYNEKQLNETGFFIKIIKKKYLDTTNN